MKKTAHLIVVLISAFVLATPVFAQQDAAPDQYGIESSPPAGEGEAVVAEGVIEKQGITTYQYGTHVLLDGDGNLLFALQSDTLSLDDYAGERVTVTGMRVPGYQDGAVEGGPDLLDVTGVDDGSNAQPPDDGGESPGAKTPEDGPENGDLAADGVLPDTGGDPTPWLLIAGTLLFGAVLVRRVVR